jgi:hypothetical protein
MKMKLIKWLPGFQPLVLMGERILLVRKYDLYVADRACKQLAFIQSVPHGLGAKLAGSVRAMQRALRAGVRFACELSPNQVLLYEGHRIWMLDLDRRSLKLDRDVSAGSRPLTLNSIQGVTGFQDGVYYGEYSVNEQRNPVNVWMRSPDSAWRIAYTFPANTVEHIHALVPDKERNVVWILTGDFDHTAGIWMAEKNFSKVTAVVIGQQEFRCCWLAFWGKQIMYATDTQLVPNSLRELVPISSNGDHSPGSFSSEERMETAGSSIYSCMVGEQLVFSTTVEPGKLSGNLLKDWLERKPGPGIKDNSVYLVAGSPEDGFATIGSWQKDKWPLRLFEFGAIKFPSGENPGPYLYAYFTAVAQADGGMGIYELVK